MKFMIAVDCEGPACVVGTPDKSLSNSNDIEFARKQATRETNACIKALFDSGATQIVVWDSHGVGVNLDFEKLDRRCEIMLGNGFVRRFPELDGSYTGVLMIGYHAMEGTKNAVLAHTYSSDAYQEIRVNGQPVGEIALDASVAGELGIPLLFLSSDDKGCKEAHHFMPWVQMVTTKDGKGKHCCCSKHPAVVEEEIYAGVGKAMERLNEMQPFLFDHPAHVEIRFKRMIYALKALIRRQGWHFKDQKTICKTMPTLLDWHC
jgi:D-amino peptidase